jgi:hypothetical protein
MYTLKVSHSYSDPESTQEKSRAENKRILIKHLIRVYSTMRLRPVDLRHEMDRSDGGRLLSIRGAPGIYLSFTNEGILIACVLSRTLLAERNSSMGDVIL